jgi:hypothetical protein
MYNNKIDLTLVISLKFTREENQYTKKSANMFSLFQVEAISNKHP